jgi:hypothetical protein
MDTIGSSRFASARRRPTSLEFAAAVEGNKEFQACQACGRWLELTPGGNRGDAPPELLPGLNRADRQFCSDVCRQKGHRQRWFTHVLPADDAKLAGALQTMYA